MKKIILLTFLSSVILFTNCNNNNDDPTPGTINIPNSNNSFGSSSAIASKGDTIRFTTTDDESENIYSIIGTAISTETLTAEFYLGKPVNSFILNIENSSFLGLTFRTPTATFVATKGTANVIVESSSIKIKFNDVTFTNNANDTKIKYSGQLIMIVDVIEEEEDGAGGSITIEGNTSPLLVTVSDDGTTYSLSGYTSTYDHFTAHFSTKPTSTVTEDLSEGETNNIYLSYSEYGSNTGIYLSKSGNATTTVDGESITVTFTDAVFDDGDGNEKTISGTIYSSL